MTVKVAINGFGRIGRSVLRAWLTRRAWQDIEITAINDVAPLETCAYLFRYDSVFGPYPGRVETARERLVVDGRSLPFTQAPEARNLDLAGVDVWMECTGRAVDRQVAEAGLAAGARRVLVSGPSPQADLTVVLGANDAALKPGHRILSNASCTTNAVAPLLALLHRELGVESGHMTTIHCYTGSQPTVDAPAPDLARSRAAALSMVPTTTSATRLTDLVLPELAGRVTGAAVRVPTASVSAVDLCVLPCGTPPESAVALNRALSRGAAASDGVIGVTEDPVVSSDMRMRSESIVLALRETAVGSGGLIRVFGWYDNEWGFSCRMLDMARTLGRMG